MFPGQSLTPRRPISLSLLLVWGLQFAVTTPLAAAPLTRPPARSSPPRRLAHAEDTASPASQQAGTPASERRNEASPPTAAPRETSRESWSVDAPPGPSHEARLDVTEGTWMSLDVSPDQTTLVFDLLGDIYTLPLSGGEARPLTHGMAWDMQPRFSPDGRHIAFTSDRGGGDNIWVMDRDGSHPRALTHESFRLLNSPAWTPDGQAIAARKHFTASRSLGAGEIWLYYLGGGDGLRMTRRPSEQKDVGEPAFSPDGHYLYYSQDVTPGSTFEYNKDPNGEIYAIKRLDRDSGESETIAGGSGGAVRPTPSPDGRSLAFVRRVRGSSRLFVQNLVSGQEREVYGPLERDMQETWAVHGVYPSMAWTRDGRSIVLWAGGHFHRVDVASGKAQEIPFHLRDTRRISDAVRFPVAVAPEVCKARMLRDVQVSPKRNQVVFEALGSLWIRDLPAGRPRRLTQQEHDFERQPSWSRDGRQIVYTTWNDDTLGRVRVLDPQSGRSRCILNTPGHYFEPVFSPDGRSVVVRRGSGGHLTSPLYSRDPGIYAVPLARSEATTASQEGTNQPLRLLTREGKHPQFGRSADRLFVTREGSDDKSTLVRLDLDKGSEKVVASSELATAFAVSPDEQWLAFQEGFQAYVTPLLASGATLEVGPKAQNLPMVRVSQDAGNYLHWSGNSQTLYWSLGPTLYHSTARAARSGLAEGSLLQFDAPHSPSSSARAQRSGSMIVQGPEDTTTGQRSGAKDCQLDGGLDLGLEYKSDKPQGTLALVGGRVVTMRGDEVLADGVVVVTENRIAAVGPRGQVTIPRDALVLDVHGKTLLPGLIDVHWHGAQGEGGVVVQRNWINYATLAFGVTTLHDPSNDTAQIFAASELARAGRILAPRIFSTGTILYGAGGAAHAEVNSLNDARRHLRRLQAVGAFSVKSYNQPRREQRQQIIAAARELGMMVVPEGGSLFEHNMTMVVDGHTGVEHSIPVPRIYKDVVQLWSQSQSGYTPTLIVGYGGIMGELWWYAHTHVWENARLAKFVPRDVLDRRSRRRPIAPDEEYNHVGLAQIARDLFRAGVSVQLGAHGQREGLGAHWELAMLVEGGMSPLEALRCGTLQGAHYLGLDRDLGSLEVGKLADLLICDRNPLGNIKDLDSLSRIVLNGRLYDARTLDELGRTPHKRGRLFFEEPVHDPGDIKGDL